MLIRPYEPSDLETCRDLWRQLTQRHRDIYADPSVGGTDPAIAFDEHLADPRLAGVWVAEDRGGVVGLCGLLVKAEQAEVEPIVVRSGHRSQGVGRRLLEHAIEEAEGRGVRFLGVRPVARNVEAFSFFYGAGFRTLGQIELLMQMREGARPEWKPGIRIHGHDLKY